MSTPAADLLSGHLTLSPGREPSLQCSRPVIGDALMRRVTAGRRATLLPELVGAVFTLCAAAHRATSRRAVAAALGQAPAARSEAAALALATAREHLQRLALDLLRAVPVAGLAPDPGWLRSAPAGAAGAAAEPARALAELSGWLAQAVFGMPVTTWLQAWRQDPEDWLAHWAQGSEHPHARWLVAVQRRARAVVLPCRALALLDDGEPGLRSVAAALAQDAQFPERPHWRGAPAETGPWTRQARPEPGTTTAWRRLGARLADLAALAEGEPLAFGALAVAAGEGLAWTEMSRGLLLHWVRLDDPRADADTARTADYRVVAPTEWNFHPHGALAAALRADAPGGALDGEHARVAAAALDPCVGFTVQEQERGHA